MISFYDRNNKLIQIGDIVLFQSQGGKIKSTHIVKGTSKKYGYNVLLLSGKITFISSYDYLKQNLTDKYLTVIG